MFRKKFSTWEKDKSEEMLRSAKIDMIILKYMTNQFSTV